MVFWIDEAAGELTLGTQEALTSSLVLQPSRDHAGWQLSQTPEPRAGSLLARLKAVLQQTSCDPGLPVRLPGGDWGLRWPRGPNITSHPSAGAKDTWDARRLLSWLVLVSTVFTGNVDLVGRGPDPGNSIVLAAAPASGVWPRLDMCSLSLAFLPVASGLRTAIQETQPRQFLAWETALGNSWSVLPLPLFQILLPDAFNGSALSTLSLQPSSSLSLAHKP